MVFDSIFRTGEKTRWKDIPGYEGRYRVSNKGDVWSVKGRFALGVIRGRYVNLSRSGEMERVKIAYLVARAFVNNSEKRPYVIHLNGDRSDHRASNLAWSEKSEEDGRGRRSQSGSRKVVCYSEDGGFVGKFSSLGEAADAMRVSKQGIVRVCNGKGKRCGGYIWRYE